MHLFNSYNNYFLLLTHNYIWTSKAFTEFSRKGFVLLFRFLSISTHSTLNGSTYGLTGFSISFSVLWVSSILLPVSPPTTDVFQLTWVKKFSAEPKELLRKWAKLGLARRTGGWMGFGEGGLGILVDTWFVESPTVDAGNWIGRALSKEFFRTIFVLLANHSSAREEAEKKTIFVSLLFK